jgi:pyruvate kinase
MPITMGGQRLLRRRTKIVATIGPSSSSRPVVERMIAAGVDVFRVNMSHSDHAGQRARIHLVREVAAAAKKHIAILADLSGPKIRTGTFAGGSIELADGDTVTVTTRAVEGKPGLIPSQYEALARDVRAGDRILLDDGNLELKVESTDGTDVVCRVVHGGRLSDRKGMNLPGVAVSAPSLTPKDREDAAFALAEKVDYLALSFVRRAADVHALRDLVEASGHEADIIAKIEKPEALQDIENILIAADGIMVARGDLGVELPPEQVPLAQSQLVDLARQAGKPVIVATQMLESMMDHARPTRAEVSDVSSAVRSGTDAIMLSGESAAGKFPVEAVEMMDRIARDTEVYMWERGAFGGLTPAASVPTPPLRLEDAIARATSQLSRDLMVHAIVVLTRSGSTAQLISTWRPQAPVLGVSARPETVRKLCLFWGVIPILIAEEVPEEDAAAVPQIAVDAGVAHAGEHILEVRGFHPRDPTRSVPLVRVFRVG